MRFTKAKAGLERLAFIIGRIYMIFWNYKSNILNSHSADVFITCSLAVPTKHKACEACLQSISINSGVLF